MICFKSEIKFRRKNSGEKIGKKKFRIQKKCLNKNIGTIDDGAAGVTTEKPLYPKAPIPKSPYTQKPLYPKAPIPKSPYTQKPLYPKARIPKSPT
jgi:hypothetical protein